MLANGAIKEVKKLITNIDGAPYCKSLGVSGYYVIWIKKFHLECYFKEILEGMLKGRLHGLIIILFI